MERRYRSGIAIDDSISGDFFAGILIDPFVKYLTCYERILRHGADSFSGFLEVLGKCFCLSPVIYDNKTHAVLIRESCLESKI